jgi:hypothetical protein
MPSVAFFKLAANVVAGLGVTKVVGDIVRNNTTVVTNGQKWMVTAGTLVLESMIVDHAVDHVNTTIDRVVAWNENRKEETPTS